MTFKFKPEHFRVRHDIVGYKHIGFTVAEAAASDANAALEAHLATCERVYGSYPCNWSPKQTKEAKKIVILFNVQPVKQEPCKHTAISVYSSTRGECQACGVKLKAAWEPCE